jgi:hypothetical protein
MEKQVKRDIGTENVGRNGDARPQQTTLGKELVLTHAFFRGQGSEVMVRVRGAESVTNENLLSSCIRTSMVGVVAVILISSASLLDLRQWICCV